MKKNCVRQKPILLLLDNHSSHIDVEVLKIAQANNVIMFALPQHTSHLYQPLDVGIFGPMKYTFRGLNTTFMIMKKENELTL